MKMQVGQKVWTLCNELFTMICKIHMSTSNITHSELNVLKVIKLEKLHWQLIKYAFFKGQLSKYMTISTLIDVFIIISDPSDAYLSPPPKWLVSNIHTFFTSDF